MHFIQIGGRKYPRVTVHWKDIIGDSAMVDMEDSSQLLCPEIVTEGYLFDSFEEDGETYIRTFATWSDTQEGVSFGDRNCFPYTVLTRNSKHDVQNGLMFIRDNND